MCLICVAGNKIKCSSGAVRRQAVDLPDLAGARSARRAAPAQRDTRLARVVLLLFRAECYCTT